MGKRRSYLVKLENKEPMIVNVVDDVNRPNNDDCDAVLEDWLHENYGNRAYDYEELESVDL